jgi:hypothetical protein
MVISPPPARTAASAAISSQACSCVLVRAARVKRSAIRSMTAVSRVRLPGFAAAKASTAALSRNSLP